MNKLIFFTLLIGCVVVVIAAIQLTVQPLYAALPNCNDACVACTITPLCGPNRLGQYCGQFDIKQYGNPWCRYWYQEQQRWVNTNCQDWCCYWLPCYTKR